jgi:hypothetical protein
MDVYSRSIEESLSDISVFDLAKYEFGKPLSVKCDLFNGCLCSFGWLALHDSVPRMNSTYTQVGTFVSNILSSQTSCGKGAIRIRRIKFIFF